MPVSIEAKGRARRDVLADIARQAALPYVADRALPALTAPVTLSLHRVPARTAVLRLLEGSSLRAVVSANGQVVIVNDSTKRPQEDTLTAVRSERVSGFVRSLATGEVLRRVTILVDNEAQVRQTNEEGYYALVLSVGPHRLRVRAISYAPFDTTIQVTTRMQLDLAMRTQESVLSAVQITGDRDERGRHRLHLAPEGGGAVPCQGLRLASDHAGVPLRDGRNPDQRMLSVAVAGVVFDYAPEPPAAG